MRRRSCTAYAARCTNDGGGGGLASDGITHFVIGSAGHELSDVEDDQKVRGRGRDAG